MDRRQFLIKAGLLSAMSTTSSVLAAIPPREAGKKVSSDGKLNLSNEFLDWRVEWKGGRVHSSGFTNKLTNKSFEISTRDEAALAFSTAKHRVDIPWWSFAYSPDETPVSPDVEKGLALGYHQADFPEKDWGKTDNLLLRRLYGVRSRGDGIVYPGYGWFRSHFNLPSNLQGESVVLGVGGHDHLDWDEYWVYINGVQVGRRTSAGRWREPSQISVAPGTPGYAALKFGSEGNVFAVRTRGYDRHFGNLSDEQLRHYIFQAVMVDQFVTVGDPLLALSNFQIQGLTVESQKKAVFDLKNPSLNVAVSLCYELNGPARRKWLEVTNNTGQELLLLDAVLDDFSTSLSMSEGGIGEPVLMEEGMFAAMEHPGGLNQGNSGQIKLMHFPAKALPPGSGMKTASSLVAMTSRGKALEEFLSYIQDRCPRKKKAIAIFDPFGITNQWGGCPTLNDTQMLQETNELEKLQQKGIKFDYYVPDSGWHDHTSDLTRFAAQCFPEGPKKVVDRLNSLDMAFGLWFSVSWGIESCSENPAVWVDQIPEPGGPAETPPPEVRYRNGYPRGGGVDANLCLAAEPYFGILKNAVLYHMRENNLRFFKLDGGDYYCNSTHHKHLPGKYSPEAMYNCLIEIATAAQQIDPNVYVMWYWGVRSPFFALHGDSIFDSGLTMEGSGTSWFPALYYRDSVNVHLDQSTQFAKYLPPLIKDSLGVWLSETRWGNYMGTERWRESLVMDLGRGNLLFPQLWGDIYRLTEEDLSFLAALNALVKAHEADFLHRKNILGDPWKNDVYGYANCHGKHGFLFINNAHFSPRKADIHLDSTLGLELERGTPVTLTMHFPHNTSLEKTDGATFKTGDTVEIWLRPFEILMLEISAAAGPQKLPAEALTEDRVHDMGLGVPLREAEKADWMDVRFEEETRFTKEGAEKKVYARSGELPDVQYPSMLAIVVRLRRKDGQAWLAAPTMIERTQVVARVGDQSLQLLPVPEARQFGNSQGLGCSWTVFKIRTGRNWSRKPLQFGLCAHLPADVEAEVEAWVVRQWWEEYELPMFEGLYGTANS